MQSFLRYDIIPILLTIHTIASLLTLRKQLFHSATPCDIVVVSGGGGEGDEGEGNKFAIDLIASK